MKEPARVKLLGHRLEQFPVDEWMSARYLGFLSAAITLADEGLVEQTIKRGLDLSISRSQIYEVILQSYLFLGFPRMLIAAECLNRVSPSLHADEKIASPDLSEVDDWYSRGELLCKRVYGESFDRLRDRVSAMAPEVFRWMILEGYGKVLSRPGLPAIEREACIVACLVMENRPAQLRSHMMGMVNVGADLALLKRLTEDLSEAAPDGYQTSREIFKLL